MIQALDQSHFPAAGLASLNLKCGGLKRYNFLIFVTFSMVNMMTKLTKVMVKQKYHTNKRDVRLLKILPMNVIFFIDLSTSQILHSRKVGCSEWGTTTLLIRDLVKDSSLDQRDRT